MTIALDRESAINKRSIENQIRERRRNTLHDVIIFQCFFNLGERGKFKEIYRAVFVEGKKQGSGGRENVSLMTNNSSSWNISSWKFLQRLHPRYMQIPSDIPFPLTRRNDEIYFYSARLNGKTKLMKVEKQPIRNQILEESAETEDLARQSRSSLGNRTNALKYSGWEWSLQDSVQLRTMDVWRGALDGEALARSSRGLIQR